MTKRHRNPKTSDDWRLLFITKNIDTDNILKYLYFFPVVLVFVFSSQWFNMNKVYYYCWTTELYKKETKHRHLQSFDFNQNKYQNNNINKHPQIE